jgi:selenocysteine-specific elongation factor
VIAADDGVMPQTREHLAILNLLHADRGVVALTKRDLVDDDWADLVTAEVKELMEGTSLADAPIVQCSATSRRGLDVLKAELDRALESLPPRRDLGRPRLPIDRVFTIGGFGTVVTGTLIDGQIAVGEELEALPGGERARVRGLQSHKQQVERAQPGTRTAVNLAGIEKSALRRGIVLARPGTMRSTTVLDARIEVLPGARNAIRHNMRVTFHVFADEANARIRLLEAGELGPGERGWAQIRLETAVAVVRGDRFVLRTANDTIGGGVVADTAPRRHRRGDGAVIAALEAKLSPDPRDALLSAIRLRPLAARDDVRAAAALEVATFESTLADAIAAGEVVALGRPPGAYLATPSDLAHLRQAAFDALSRYHGEHPLRAGMPQEELRTRVGLDTRAFPLFVEHTGELRVEGATARLSGFAPALTPVQRGAADAWLDEMRRAPGRSPVAAAPDSDVIAYLIARGEVVDAGDGLYFAASACAEMTDRVRAHIAAEGAITLAQTRDLLQTNRKYAQAFLEHLDRQRITVRSGDERRLRGG